MSIDGAKRILVVINIAAMRRAATSRGLQTSTS
jgi:hypothetical protein